MHRVPETYFSLWPGWGAQPHRFWPVWGLWSFWRSQLGCMSLAENLYARGSCIAHGKHPSPRCWDDYFRGCTNSCDTITNFCDTVTNFSVFSHLSLSAAVTPLTRCHPQGEPCEPPWTPRHIYCSPRGGVKICDSITRVCATPEVFSRNVGSPKCTTAGNAKPGQSHIFQIYHCHKAAILIQCQGIQAQTSLRAYSMGVHGSGNKCNKCDRSENRKQCQGISYKLRFWILIPGEV